MDERPDVMLFVVPLMFAAAGVYIIRTPAKRLLRWDRRTGYWLYQRELKNSGDEEQALSAAGTFYKLFGWLLILFSLLYTLIVLLGSLLHYLGNRP